ncbi:MAG TPA: hypothetical protein VFA26_03715 [Gemmataceae bacterium]|nr:hypothetical protein [Gemmataceae bacterium]
MSTLRRVFADRAGPSAVGILVPPGRRTLLIVRPRGLPWDLLLVHPADGAVFHTTFRDLDRAEAESAAAGLCAALEAWAGGGPGQVEVVAEAGGQGWCVCAEVGPFPLIACRREPGRPYRPERFATQPAAEAAAAQVAGALRPPPGACREVYFNTNKFGR